MVRSVAVDVVCEVFLRDLFICSVLPNRDNRLVERLTEFGILLPEPYPGALPETFAVADDLRRDRHVLAGICPKQTEIGCDCVREDGIQPAGRQVEIKRVGVRVRDDLRIGIGLFEVAEIAARRERADRLPTQLLSEVSTAALVDATKTPPDS